MHTLKIIMRIISPIIAVAILFLAGIIIAACVKKTTFSEEWANMIEWFKTWAR